MNSGTMEKILGYIDTHIREKISLCELSNIAGYSPFYFSKLFSEIMGMPVTGYIRIRKLQYAVVSLLEGYKVIDVALLYSFDSHEGFTRSFKQLFGSTPSTVRKYLISYMVPEFIVPDISNRRINMEATNTTNLQHCMHQLIYEVLENSLDEAKEGHCTKIEVVLLPGNRIKIVDIGRGIPLSKDLHASKAVLDKILAGSPITNVEFSQMGDLVQAGMQTVNSLCKTLQITVYREGNRFQQDYIRGIAQHDLCIENSLRSSGTEIIFKPDKIIFGEVMFSKVMILDWLTKKSTNLHGLEMNVYSVNK